MPSTVRGGFLASKHGAVLEDVESRSHSFLEGHLASLSFYRRGGCCCGSGGAWRCCSYPLLRVAVVVAAWGSFLRLMVSQRMRFPEGGGKFSF